MKISEADHFGLSFLLAFFKIGVVIGAAGVLLGFLGRHYWLLDLMAQLRVQWAIGFVTLFILFLLLRKKRWALLCVIILIVNSVPMWPYIKGIASQYPDISANNTKSTIRLMSLNVLTHNEKKAEAISAVKSIDPDVLMLMEVDAKWENAVRTALSADYPHITFHAREDNFGIALLSKTPWDHLEIFPSAPIDLPSIDVTFTDENSRSLHIFGTHPFPPLGSRNWNIRNVHLMDTARRVNNDDPTIMIGDFNLTPWSPVFKDLITTTGLRDSGTSFGMTPTWDVVLSPIGALKIDHALVSEHIVVKDLEIQKVDGSDHRALVLDIQY